MEQLSFTDNVDSLFRSLENFTQNEGIIGKPVTQGDKTFLPVVSITIGGGGGNASMKGKSSSSPGMPSSSATGTGALGLGAKLCTDAVIVIDKDNVSLLPMNSSASSLMDKIPQIITGMTSKQGQAQGQSSQGQSSQGQTGQSQEQSWNQSQGQTQQSPAYNS